jgi:hypothetical protein
VTGRGYILGSGSGVSAEFGFGKNDRIALLELLCTHRAALKKILLYI